MKCQVQVKSVDSFQHIDCGERAVIKITDLSKNPLDKKNLYMCGVHAWDWKKYLDKPKTIIKKVIR